jgi:hypothetical protein
MDNIVLNIFGSFGYFEHQADDERVVAAWGAWGDVELGSGQRTLLRARKPA